MSRAWAMWLIYGACVAIVLAALGGVTLLLVRMDLRETRSQQLAAVEEDIRLALWRMDWAAGAIVARENARPYSAYQPFSPAAAVSNRFEPLDYGAILLPSPLLGATQPFVKLYFQIEPEGRLTSPQAPAGPLQQIAIDRYHCTPQITFAAAELEKFRQSVGVAPTLAAAPALDPATTGQTKAVEGSGGYIESTARLAPAPGLLNNRYESRAASDQQAQINQSELAARKKLQADANVLRKSSPSPAAGSAGIGSAAPQGRRGPPAKISASSRLAPERHREAEVVVVREGSMQAVWVGQELLLLRRVLIGGRELVQGCWLDWQGLRPWLLKEVADLLPNATLLPADGHPNGRSSSRLMAALPTRLEPGAVATIATGISTPTLISLLVIWGAAALAAIAVTALLGGAMALSNRRAAFVSAVTHELRTPLTTFRLYTDMLRRGMVADPRKQWQYIQTLDTESNRLAHLIENVLSYARLERGADTVNEVETDLHELITQITPRLQERAGSCGMELVVDTPGSCAGVRVLTDPAAVERIVFNLIDNACKYAGGATDRRLHLEVACRPVALELRVRDHGPGISPAAMRTLFRPFSKSARAAATGGHGVGLGLALCLRLARRLGGDLCHEHTSEPGAVFVLTLPAAACGARLARNQE